MAARVSDFERFDGGDFGAAREEGRAAEAGGDLLGDLLGDLSKDGTLSDGLGMGYLQITNA
jgi:hypothetical protein